MALALVRGDLAGLAFPFLLAASGFLLLMHGRGSSQRFPGTDLERRLNRLFALLLPVGKANTSASLRLAMAQQIHLAGLRRGARRWGGELQLITTDGYETVSRLSALRARRADQDDRVLAADAVETLRAERAGAGADLTSAGDPVSMLAYGLGARPAGTDLTSLDDLLRDLGLAEGDDPLRTHFDDVLAGSSTAAALLRSDAERTMFRDLAGASFVLGVAARVLELASRSPSRDLAAPLAAAG
jgi:hypothetical protein